MPSIRDNLSFSLRNGGDNFRKVLKSPISFSFSDKLFIDTPTEKSFPLFLFFQLPQEIFEDI